MQTVTITYDIDNLFSLVNQRSLYWSKQLDKSVEKADILPITNDEEDFFHTMLKLVANDIWLKLARYYSEDIEDPFQLNIGEGDSTYSNSLVYIIYVPDHWEETLHSNPLSVAIQQAIVHYVCAHWLMMKGAESWKAEMMNHEKYMKVIPRTLMYKQRTTQTYRTL